MQLTVRVIPRASKPGIAGTRDGALLVRLQSPPVEGAANAELMTDTRVKATFDVPREHRFQSSPVSARVTKRDARIEAASREDYVNTAPWFPARLFEFCILHFELR